MRTREQYHVLYNYLTPAKAAKLLPGQGKNGHATPGGVIALIKAGSLGAVKIGNRYFTSREWIDEFLEQRKVA